MEFASYKIQDELLIILNNINKEQQKNMQGTQQQLQTHIIQTYPPGSTGIDISLNYQLKIGPKGALIIRDMINWSIHQLNLNMYFIENEGMKAIMEAGGNWPFLGQLVLERNNIGCEGLRGIQLVDWRYLKKLNLNKNMIKATGFSYMVKANWPVLQVLQLSHNQIGTQGAAMFPLANWPNLQILNLNYNLIGTQGMRQLSKCKLPHLRKLFLSNNKLYAKGIYYLSNIQLPNLESLGLNRNFIGRNENNELTQLGCFYLKRLKIKPRGLSNLHIFGNDITLNGIKGILQMNIFKDNSFMELTKNLFDFQEIQQDLVTYNIFSDKF